MSGHKSSLSAIHIHSLHADTAKSELNQRVKYIFTYCMLTLPNQKPSHHVHYYWLLHFILFFHSSHADSDTAQSQDRNVSLV